MRIIAGIGSRQTPKNILLEMEKIGRWCFNNRVFVRSGHAHGADYAFEKGAKEMCICFLPWKSFNAELPKTGAVMKIIPITIAINDLIDKFHPNPAVLSDGARRLMGRNNCQVLGERLNSPVKAVICWTKDGGATGGTGQAIRIANTFKIPILNMFYEEYATSRRVITRLKTLL